ncbi:MAG: DKNYY domain-containing protein [Patescibacteria group bacterium]|nr:DKNYY domain-containing protein [Patescibacteria group bacterium]
MFNKKSFFVCFIVMCVLANCNIVRAEDLANSLKGKILLEVEKAGEAWYVNPNTLKRHYLGRPKDAFNLMQTLGLGISNSDLEKIPVAEMNMSTCCDDDNDGLSFYFESAFGTNRNLSDSDGDGISDKSEILNGYNPIGAGKLNWDTDFAKKQAGKILLQVENAGEAWYVNPDNNKRYFLGFPMSAFNVMRFLGLGISNRDIDNIAKDFIKEDLVSLDWRYNDYQERYGDLGYKKIGDKIIYKEKVNIELENPDLDSFEVIHYRYAKDDNHIYDKGKIVYKNIDSKTFDLIMSIRDDSYYIFYYFIDQKNVYDIFGKIVSMADPNTITAIPNCYPYSKDKDDVFFNSILIKEADEDSFVPIICDIRSQLFGYYKQTFFGYSLMKDNNNVYYREKIINGADPETIIYLGGDFSKDKHYVYKNELKLEHIDITGFQFLPNRYSKNYNSVFHKEILIPEADPGSFEVVGIYYTKDKNNVYYKTNIIKDADIDTFEVPKNKDYRYARDKNNFYENGEIILDYPTNIIF